MSSNALPSRNTEWGFFGTIGHHADAQTAWPLAMAAVSRWMGWSISRRTECEMGIPRGLPYLTGFVTHCEIEAEAFG